MRTERTAQEAVDELGAAVDELIAAMFEERLLSPWIWLRQKWQRLGLWHRESLRWEGIARDYGERLEGLGDWDWISEYRDARHAAWWGRWDE